MTTTPNEPVASADSSVVDEDIETVAGSTPTPMPGGDTDSTDGSDADGTDGDSTDGDSTDGDSTDGADADGTDA